MSIYENGPKTKASKTSRTKTPSQKADPKQILNDKSLTELIKQLNGGPKTAKELLYDSEKNVIGVLQRNDTPFFLTQTQSKELEKLLGK